MSLSTVEIYSRWTALTLNSGSYIVLTLPANEDLCIVRCVSCVNTFCSTAMLCSLPLILFYTRECRARILEQQAASSKLQVHASLCDIHEWLTYGRKYVTATRLAFKIPFPHKTKVTGHTALLDGWNLSCRSHLHFHQSADLMSPLCSSIRKLAKKYWGGTEVVLVM